MARGPRSRSENPIVYLDVKIGERLAGRLLIELRADVVPRTAENFRRLCTGETRNALTGRRRHLANCSFHRVVHGKFCQSGDYLNHDGSGGASTFEDADELSAPTSLGSIAPADPLAFTPVASAFADENFVLRHTGAGVLSMANTGPDSNTSQFYLHFGPSPLMDDQHVVFGCLVGPTSFAVLDTIHGVATARGDPKSPVKITTCGQVDTSTMHLSE